MVSPVAGASRRSASVRDALLRARSVYKDIFVDDWGPKRGLRARVVSLVFLSFLSGPVVTVLHSDWPVPRRVAALAGLALFAGCFTFVVWRNTPVLHTNRAPRVLVAGVVVGLGVVALGSPWLSGLSIYTVAMLLYNCSRRWWMSIVLGVPLVSMAIDRLALRAGVQDTLVLGGQILVVGVILIAFYQQVRAKLELARARTDLARLAVTEERLRISRDLHDILGQRLSAVSLKAELASRLVDRDPERAAEEMREVAAVARQALADVRETVSGYRLLSLAAEIETGRALLTAAGLAVEVEADVEGLAEPVDECAGAVVREAITNVIRHACADRCAIRVAVGDGSVVVEIRDTGTGQAGEPVMFGNGLTGLAERVAGVGGTIGTGREGREFVIRATLPVNYRRNGSRLAALTPPAEPGVPAPDPLSVGIS